MTARLAAQLRNGDHANHLAFRPNRQGGFEPMQPAEIARRFNDRMFDELSTEHYFTMALADIDLETGQLELVQAGHPQPIIYNEEEGPRLVGGGGLPIGLVPEREFEQYSLQLNERDTLILYSDGLTECAGPNGEQLEEEGLMDMFAGIGPPDGPEYFSDLIWSLEVYVKGKPFADDLSAARLTLSEIRRASSALQPLY